ncbi:magnesium transporter CorA family protein [Brevundimonas sp.]|uniref:magnesium transporter CorA family protein n=1 Tax=Brevundimonas sp. TaxID=1871086 RepID=UPI002B6C6798|nr:magnesium transporter CorA family protein [Brevundimonas sp.]HWQ85448.1 magnesium transporter CorA family protein [Brevundimonas sp.]
MIRVWCAGRAACEPPVDPAVWTLPPDAIWIDMVKPSREEDAAVERALGLSIPTREEMAELEASSRVYRENHATYATADIITHGDEEVPGVEPVTFVVTDGPLVTIRYVDPKPFALMAEKLTREPMLCATGADLFLHLMETVIDRVSDILSGTVTRVEGIAGHVFSGGRTVGFEKLITKLGRAQMTNARIEQSLAGLTRIFAFVGIDERMGRGEGRAHLRSLTRDADSLSAHNHAVAASINFQLSAALGLINIEQSSIIKIFSVAAVAFLPPTLIASIYGMNFRHMPELSQPWGYPLAVVAMVISALLPLAWFKKKGWL